MILFNLNSTQVLSDADIAYLRHCVLNAPDLQAFRTELSEYLGQVPIVLVNTATYGDSSVHPHNPDLVLNEFIYAEQATALGVTLPMILLCLEKRFSKPHEHGRRDSQAAIQTLAEDLKKLYLCLMRVDRRSEKSHKLFGI